jgi:hypothetical protein
MKRNAGVNRSEAWPGLPVVTLTFPERRSPYLSVFFKFISVASVLLEAPFTFKNFLVADSKERISGTFVFH